MPTQKPLGMQDGPECLVFNPHDQRFTFNVFASGSVWMAIEGEEFTRCPEMDQHADRLRCPSSDNITHWRVSRLAHCLPVVEQVANGQFLFRVGPVADYLLTIADDGGINEPVSDLEADSRRQDAEYDLRMQRDISDTDRAMMTAINTGNWT